MNAEGRRVQVSENPDFTTVTKAVECISHNFINDEWTRASRLLPEYAKVPPERVLPIASAFHNPFIRMMRRLVFDVFMDTVFVSWLDQGARVQQRFMHMETLPGDWTWSIDHIPYPRAGAVVGLLNCEYDHQIHMCLATDRARSAHILAPGHVFFWSAGTAARVTASAKRPVAVAFFWFDQHPADEEGIAEAQSRPYVAPVEIKDGALKDPFGDPEYLNVGLRAACIASHAKNVVENPRAWAMGDPDALRDYVASDAEYYQRIAATRPTAWMCDAEIDEFLQARFDGSEQAYSAYTSEELRSMTRFRPRTRGGVPF